MNGEELSESEEAWECAKGGAGGEENIAKNRRKNADLPSTSSAQTSMSQSYLNYYTHTPAVIA